MYLTETGDTGMFVAQKFFHTQKDKFTTIKEYGRGEARGGRVIDHLTRQTLIVDGNQITEWYLKGCLKFRMTSYPVKAGEVFSQADYEIL